MAEEKNYGSITRLADGRIGQKWVSIPAGLTAGPTTGTWNAGDIAVGLDGYMWVCTVAGTPGTWQQMGTGTLNGSINLTGSMTIGTGLVVSAGGAAITGNSTVTGNLNVTGILTFGSLGTTVTVPWGGTGQTTLTNHGVLVGAGTSPITQLAVGTTGQVLIGSTGADPAFGALGVNSGLTAHGVLLGQNNSAITALAVGATNSVLQGTTGADPTFTTTPTVATLTTTGLLTAGNGLTVTTGNFAVSAGNSTIAGTETITSANASAFAVGRLGATTPAFVVDASTATSITGVSVKSAASGGNVTLSAVGETNVSLLLAGIGTGIVQTTATTASATVGAFKAINSNASNVGMAVMLSNLAANNAANAAELGFSMNNNTPTEKQFGAIRVTSSTVTASSEQGTMILRTINAGTMTTMQTINNLGTQFGGGIAVGAAPLSQAVVRTAASITASGGAGYGIVQNDTIAAAANSDSLYGLVINPTWTASGKTGLALVGIRVEANSTAPDNTSTKTGIIVAAQTGANSTNIGVDIAAPSGATTNIGLRNAGTTSLSSVVGIGGNPTTDRVINITGALTTTGTSNYGFVVNWTASSSATSELYGYYQQLITANAAYTVTNMYNIRLFDFSKSGSSAVTNNYGLKIEAFSNASTSWGVYSDTQNYMTNLFIGSSGSTNNKFSTASAGGGSTTMWIGNASINVTSDARIKTIHGNYTGNAVEVLNSLDVKEFTYHTDHRPFGGYDGRTVGFTAQDMNKVAPWSVNTQGGNTCQNCLGGRPCDEHPVWHARYEMLNGLLVKAIQELDERTRELERIKNGNL